MTPERIAEIRDRYNKSTSGQWEVEPMRPGDKYTWIRSMPSNTPIAGTAGRMLPGDAQFIAQAHQDIPALVADLTLAQQLIGKMTHVILNQQGDNLCWITNPDTAKALPEAQFMESCRRHRAQIASERGEFTEGRTIAQLEARVVELELELESVSGLLSQAVEMWETHRCPGGLK